MNTETLYKETKILIVDDAPENVKALERILKQAGYQHIYSTTDAREAPGLYQTIQPHAVLLDLNMPYLDGFQVIERMMQASNSPYVPVLMLTATNSRDVKLRALEEGAKDFLTKPFDRHEVIARINTISEVSHLHNHLNNLNKALQDEVEERTRELQLETRNRQQVEAHARNLALHDTLTGLPNRTLLVDRLQQSLYGAAHANNHVAVLLIDLVRFKDVNNTLGHVEGDTLLKCVSDRLSAELCHTDRNTASDGPTNWETVARLGGDEFAVLLPALSSVAESKEVAQRIQALFEKSFVIGGITFDIGARVSVVVYPEHGDDPEMLLQRAEVAMYTAKKERRNCVIYSPDQDHFSATRLTLMSELKEAINQDALSLCYQPKIDLASGSTTGLEALLRWPHKDRGILSPDSFVPMAEETGMIAPLSRWVLRRAARDCTKLATDGYRLNVSINLSAYDLMDEAFAEEVARVLEEFKLAPELITLEVTESAMMHDPEKALAVITSINEMGVKFSIDDFGTGYSSLAYLKKLPVSEIKIDKSFVRDMAEDSDDAVIVHSTVELAHNLGLKVVAEGIENGAIMELLKQLRCDLGQGYHMAPPLVLEQVRHWLETSPWGRVRSRHMQVKTSVDAGAEPGVTATLKQALK